MTIRFAWKQPLELCVRLLSALALLVVATYYLLASVPFAFYHFLQFPHFWWMAALIRFHPVVLAVAVAAFSFTLRDVPARLKPWIRYVVIAAATITACMIAIGWEPLLLTYPVASTLSFVPLLLLLALSGIELAAHRDLYAGHARPGPNADVTVVAAAAAAWCAVAYFVEAARHGAIQRLERWEIVGAGGMSLAAHAALFVFAVLVITLINTIAVRRRWSRAGERIAAGGWVALLVAVFFRFSILPALTLGDVRETALAAVLGVVLVALFGAFAVRPGRSGSERLPVSVPSHAGNWWRAASRAAIALACIIWLPRLLMLADWGGTIQKMVVVASWAAIAGVVAALPTVRWRRRALIFGFAASLITIAGVTAVSAAAASSVHKALDMSLALDRYATFDPSFRVLLEISRPVVADREFFEEVRRKGERTADSSMPAVGLQLTDGGHLTATPNIFIIVVDSMRPDYLLAYNRAATFTPAIGAFAADSIVMRNAFTPYAGTALSEPAVWAGGLIPRAMYVKPFAPMNNLARLLQDGGYRQYISVDEILKEILDDRKAVIPLDAYLAHEAKEHAYRFDLCGTLPELDDRLDHDQPAGPVFFYSQPQNMHIRVLADERFPVFEGVRVGGAEFFKPAATTLSRLDSCFGAFIDHLKTIGKYDNSIVVLTSDHGDAYGEAGRWGHAFYVSPEIMRIPLILHVPPSLLAGRVWDVDALALLSDVTPTLYDLMGNAPTSDSALSGHSLMPLASNGQVLTRRSEVFIQSSYSPAFGVLDGAGRWMYVADGNRGQEQWFDLTTHDPFPKAMSAADRLQYRKWMFDWLDVLNRHYRPN